jgi:membrane fusion protein, heavy metal efflux system
MIGRMRATPSLIRAATAPAVSQRVIVYEGDSARGWVAGADGTIAGRSARVGQIAGGIIGILAGLSQGEKDATSGAASIDRAAGND